MSSAFVVRRRHSYQATLISRAASVFLALAWLAFAFFAGFYVQDSAYAGSYHVDGDTEKKSLPGWLLTVGLIAFMAFCAACYAAARHYPTATLLGALACGVCLAPYTALVYPMAHAFEYLKLYSVLAGFAFMQLFRLDHAYRHQRHHKIGAFSPAADDEASAPQPARAAARWLAGALERLDLQAFWWKWILWATLAINIAEATVSDVAGTVYGSGDSAPQEPWGGAVPARLVGIPNAVAGVWLIYAMPRAFVWHRIVPRRWDRRIGFMTHLREHWTRVLYVDTAQEPRGLYDMVYTTPLFWALMYCSWNAAFSLRQRREHFAVVVTVLAAALFGDFNASSPSQAFQLEPHLFVQCRAVTLCARFVSLAFYDVYERYLNTAAWYSVEVVFVWGCLNVAAVAVYAAWRTYTFTGEQDRTSARLEDGDTAATPGSPAVEELEEIQTS